MPGLYQDPRSVLGRFRLNPDRKVQYRLATYSQALLDAGIAPSVETKCDYYDNAPSESNNALYKAEMVRPQSGFNGTTDLEWATLLSVGRSVGRSVGSTIGDSIVRLE